MSPRGGDGSSTDPVTKSAGQGACGEAVTPRCDPRAAQGTVEEHEPTAGPLRAEMSPRPTPLNRPDSDCPPPPHGEGAVPRGRLSVLVVLGGRGERVGRPRRRTDWQHARIKSGVGNLAPACVRAHELGKAGTDAKGVGTPKRPGRRSLRSSPRPGKPVTWRRKAVSVVCSADYLTTVR